MKIKRITRSWLRNNEACYSDEQIAALVPEEGVTLQQVLETDRIPHEDKIWVVTREKLLPETIMATWLAGIVEQTLRRLENTDPRYVAVVSLLRRIAAGGEVSQEERDQIRNEARHAVYAASAAYAATYAACHAADYAADYAAWDAAWGAAHAAYHAANWAAYYATYATYAATYAAYHAADWGAACAADCAAQEDEECKQQVQDLLALLGD